MPQSDQYNDKEEIAYLANFPGAAPDEDWIIVRIAEGEVDITDRDDRNLGFVDVDSPVSLEDVNEDQINPATEETLSSISDAVATEETLNALARALGSNEGDYLIFDQNSPLDVSDATVTVTEDGPVDVSAAVVSIQEDNPLDVSASTVTVTQQDAVTLAENNATNIGKVRNMDSDGVLVDPVDADNMQPISASTSSTGASNAASLDLGAHRKDVDVFYDLSGSGDVTIEVSTDAATWRTLHTESLGAAETDILQFETSYQHIRAYANQNINTVEVVSKGD